MLDDNKLGRLAAAVGDGQQRAHAQFLHVLALEHFDFELVAARERTGLFRQICRRADVRRQVAEVAGEIDAFADRHAFCQRCFQPGGFFAESEHQALQGFFAVLAAFQALEAVSRFERYLRGLRDHPCRIVLLHLYLRDEEGRLAGAGIGERPYCAAYPVTEFLWVGRLLLAETGKQDALAGNAGQVEKHDGCARLRVEAAVLEHRGDAAARGAIQRFRGLRQFAGGKHRNHDAAAR